MARARESKPARDISPVVFVVQLRGRGVADSVFTDRASAEERRRELDRTARAHANPFALGWSKYDDERESPFRPNSPEGLSSDSGGRFWEVLTALHFPPPDKDQEWSDWWETLYASTLAEQRDALWDTLDDLHHFDVIEVPLED